MEPLNVILPRDLREFLAEQVANGSFACADELIVEALYYFRDVAEHRRAKLERLRADIAVGSEQADRGELAPLDMEAIKAKVRERP